MYHFALCDDEQEELKKTEILLQQYQKMHPEQIYTTKHFTSTEALLTTMEADELFDLIFLDIYLPGKNGIETALKLRKIGCSCPIVFLTTSKDHALEAFRVQPVHYLVKPLEPDRFFATLDAICSHLEKERKRFITIKSGGILHRVSIHDIIYCESHNNHQYINLTGRSCIRLRITAAELYSRLAQFPEFVRCGVAYTINLNHVECITRKEVAFENGSRIPVARGAYGRLREQYFNYYCDESDA